MDTKELYLAPVSGGQVLFPLCSIPVAHPPLLPVLWTHFVSYHPHPHTGLPGGEESVTERLLFLFFNKNYII